MFNAPRRHNPSLSQSAFYSPSSSSTPAFDPLAASTPNPSYGNDVDPWSGTGTPIGGRSNTDAPDAQASTLTLEDAAPRTNGDEEVIPQGGGFTRLPSEQARSGNDGLNEFMSDPPPLYLSLLDQMDKTPDGEVSLSSVHRLLSSSKLPAAAIEKIVNLTSRDKSSLSRPEFFCTLGLVALAQSKSSEPSSISIENLSATLSDLPLPKVNASSSILRPNTISSPSYLNSESPWDTTPRPPKPYQDLTNGHAPQYSGDEGEGTFADGGEGAGQGRNNGSSRLNPGSHGRDITGYSIQSALMEDAANPEAEAERGFWKRMENYQVDLIKEKEGWFLQKYTIHSDQRPEPISRRYSDFVWLLDCLLKRYPFRLLPSLPPKKISPDAMFLERRRKGLKRFLNMIVNHPVLRVDGALSVFLTETNFEAWRKRVKVSTEEESSSKSLSAAQISNIPSDLDEKLGTLRDNLPSLLSSYQKLVLLAEKSLIRLQTQSADCNRFALCLRTAEESITRCCYRNTSTGESGENGIRGGSGGEGCSLCAGVSRGVGEVAEGWTKVAEAGEKRAMNLLLGSIEALKCQRDLYLAFRDLFLRHDRLSKDNVEALRKKVEGRDKKIETLKAGQKPGWGVEVEKLVSASDQDQAEITRFLARRIFIKSSMWHELSVVFHTRQAAQATLGWREFVRTESEEMSRTSEIWRDVGRRLEGMPVE